MDICPQCRLDSYFVSGRKESLQNEEIEYEIHILRLLADQRHNLQLDPSYVPMPVLNERLSQSFHVPPEIVVKCVTSSYCFTLLLTFAHLDTPISSKEIEFCWSSSTLRGTS
jgi:hypothetical protein